ncbi:NucA/NucB deoxyribonuclease domain-containing protein [Paenibacillus alba]|uniref:NucA/NucB deoxyribonuclease domain-containing protein n=1 Tax=Paenibacillus alba TaxID=1197127 RepID=A0ABU6GEC2_9BACL|nr:NucA/NucB deoxyribonuclease domain-containing protein [Paenibacillus alba]MEC0232565.1 NucA/NucB deoxyribonuclease domain-containing protein [Paenibacillus alba]
MKKKTINLFIVAVLVIAGFYVYKTTLSQNTSTQVTLVVPSERFPETAAHIKTAEEHGESQICTINRKGAEANRKESLKGVPTKKGYDRDEFPMAMCAEGGKGADIQYVTPSDNRGAGSWIANQLEKYEDGTKVLIIVK